VTLDLHKTALVVIDPQVSFCDRGGAMDRQGRDIAPLRDAVAACDELAGIARAGGAMVIWTRMVFAPGYTDGGELTTRIRPNLARIGALERGSGDENLSDLVTPAPTDLVIDKPRFSAWIGTGLEVALNARGIDTVMVCGITTSMCVESTVRDIGQRDYRTFVVGDACADFDPAVHAASLAAMQFGFATGIDCAEAKELLKG
jgi:ureidoacrylate peracid hydrolase|tara:strand:+ start:168 stop:773 length:606 start_codon:yes stop_codon:yes gene_type:complete